MNKVVLTGVLVLLSAQASLAEPFRVDPTVGNSTMSAVFDAPLGERINAVSSSIDCALDVDTVKGTASGKCSIPLSSIIVDNQPTKTSHFQQWATNKKVEPEKCTFDLSFKDIKVVDPIKPQTPLPFNGEGVFTICGRSRTDGKPEKFSGSVILLPAGTYNPTATVRIRAKIENFNREAYQIGPKWTDGWLARVQQLGPVVAAEGTIEGNLFAVARVPGNAQ